MGILELPTWKLTRAGNLYDTKHPSSPTPEDLITPTIKQDVYSTGRGGSGNMRHFDKNHPEIARTSQDVEEPPKRSDEHVQFAGRGICQCQEVTPFPRIQRLTHHQEESPTLSCPRPRKIACDRRNLRIWRHQSHCPRRFLGASHRRSELSYTVRNHDLSFVP